MKFIREQENEIAALAWVFWLSVGWVLPLIMPKTLFVGALTGYIFGYFLLIWIAAGMPKPKAVMP